MSSEFRMSDIKGDIKVQVLTKNYVLLYFSPPKRWLLVIKNVFKECNIETDKDPVDSGIITLVALLSR